MDDQLTRYNLWLGSGAMDPDHYGDCVRCLIAQSRGQEAASRASRLLGVVRLLGTASRALPALAWLASRPQRDVPDEVPSPAGLPGWVAEPLAEVASFAILSGDDLLPLHVPAGVWRRGDRGLWLFQPREHHDGVVGFAFPQQGGGRQANQGEWSPYVPKKGRWAGQQMEKNERTGEVRPMRQQGQGGPQDQGGGRMPGRGQMPPMRGGRGQTAPPGNRYGGPQGQAFSPPMSKKDALKHAKNEQMNASRLMKAVGDIFGGLKQRVKDLTAKGWDKLARSKNHSHEVRELAGQLGYKPGRLRGLPGKALEALADRSRRPASERVPLSRRGDVPNLREAKSAFPSRDKEVLDVELVDEEILDVLPVEDEPQKPIPLAEAEEGRIPRKTVSAGERDQAQQEGLPSAATPRAAAAVREVKDHADRMGDPQVRASVGKMVERLNFTEALHVFRNLVPHSEQGVMPVPRTSRECADALVRGLSAKSPREDAGAIISRDRPSWFAGGLMVSALGDKHEEMKRADKANKERADKLAKSLGAKAPDSPTQQVAIPPPPGRDQSEAAELAAQKKEVIGQRLKIADAGRQVLAASLSPVGSPAAFDVSAAPEADLGPKHEEEKAKALKFLSGVLRDANVKLHIVRAKGDRAAASSPKTPGGPTTLKLAPNTPAKIIVHEIGHAIEDQVPGAKEAAVRFLEYRCGKEKPRDMGEVGGQPGEIGRKDNFDKHFNESGAHYVGRVYKHGATEVISMGLEQMYNDPVGFAKNDPEYFALIHGILSGSGRAK